MTTAYSNLLGLALPVTGELSGTWGDTVNDYITKYLDDAIANAQVISGSQTAVTLSKTTGTALVAAGSGSTGSAQYALIRCTGNPASTLTITVSYSSLTNSQFSKTYLIFNSTSTNQSVVVQATTSSGTSTGVTITAGERALIAWNGTDFVKIATQSGTGEFVTVDTTNLEVTNIKAKDGTAAATIADSTGAITVSTLLNVDNLRLDGNTLSSTDSNGNVVLAPNGTGDVQLDADTVRVGDSAAAVTLTSNGAGALTVTTGGAADLILNTNSGTNSGSITIGNGTNGNITVATNGTGDFYVDADTVRIGDSNANATITTNGTGDLILNTNAGTNSGSITIEDGVNGNIIIAPNGTGQVQISNAALDLTTIEVTNIKAKDGTASMTLADTTGIVTFSKATVIETTDNTNAALRVTQLGTGNAILVEDSANPDSTPFVVTAAGDVGIGVASPATKLDVFAGATGAWHRFEANAVNESLYSNYSAASGYQTMSLAASTFRFFTGAAGGGSATEKMRLDTSGNLGLGVTTLSPWLSAVRVLQIGAVGGTVIGGNTSAGGTSFFGQNYYYDTSYKFETANAATYYAQTAGQHQWWRSTATPVIGNDPVFSQAMTLDASGRLGIGETNPTTRLYVKSSGGSGTAATLQTDAGVCVLNFINTGTTSGTFLGSTGTALYFATDGAERARITSGGDFRVKGAGTAGSTDAFQISGSAPADAARLNSAGEWLVGTTSAAAGFPFTYKAAIDGGAANGLVCKNSDTASLPISSWNSATSGDNYFVGFYTEGGTGTFRGSIDYNRAGGLVRYNTTSDYRAKDIIGPLQNTGATIDALKVYEGKMKGATQARPMLIAHEAQEYAPYAVSGVKDEINADGSPKYQQMDVSSLVPLLLAEIQSLRARVAQLEAK